MLALLAAAALAAAPLAQEEDSWADLPDEEERGPHVLVSVWGGEALPTGGSGRSSALLGGEVAWMFRSLDLGIAGYGYRNLPDARSTWSPVAVLRVTQRFPTRRGLEAALTFGMGAARPDSWTAWYQLALGFRLPLGPVFLGGEVGFERYDLLRLAAGIGAAF